MKRLLKHAKKYWWTYAIGIIMLVLGMWLDFKNPVIIGQIVDDVIIGKDLTSFRHLITMLILITVGRAVFGYIKEITFDLGGFEVVRNLRMELFDHIQGLSEDFFARKTTGELMSRIKEDPEKLWYGSSFGIMLVIEQSFYFIIATIMMISVSFKLSLFVLAVMPFVGMLAAKLEKTIGEVYGEISEQNAKLNTVAQENISGVRLVKAFAREKYEVKKFLNENKAYYDLNVKQMKIWSRFFPSIELIYNLLIVFVVVFGGMLVIGEEMTLGTLVRFSQYTYMVIWPMRMIGWLSNLMAEANASMKKINKIFDETPAVSNPKEPLDVAHLKGRIEYKHVGLVFGDKEVLHDINFTIEEGKTLAIMGEAGSGKSMIASLLCRFHNQTMGEILIDGHKTNQLRLKTLRSHIAMVMQDTFLFSDTIEENIKLGGKEVISSEHMTSAAKSAMAHDFIQRMDEQYETIIGEKGIGLSGGQKQRISMARALAKEAPILIFDDSTSALDMETERKVQKAIDAMTGVSKLIIAHRISAVMKADEIIVLAKGHIIERGTHNELMAQRGQYFETYMEQYEGYKAYDTFKEIHPA